MNTETEKNKRNLRLVLICVCSALLIGLLCAKLVAFFVASSDTDILIRDAIQATLDSENIDTNDADSQKILDNLKRKNLFMPIEQRDCPIKDVNGIMGNEVLIKGQWYKVGDRVGDAIILEVGASYAKVKWFDSEKILELSSELPVQATRQQMAQRTGARFQINQPTRPQQVAESQQTSQNQDQLAWMGVQLTTEQRQKVEMVWNRMPEQFRSMMQQQWSNMPQAERTRSLQELDRMSVQQLEESMNQTQRMMEQGLIQIPQIP